MKNITNEFAFGNHAARLAQLGHAVFPINPSSGLPYGNDQVAKAAGLPMPENGQGGINCATTDQNTVAKWSVAFPNALIGIRTGTASGLYVLDVDRKNGKDGFNTLFLNNWATPETPNEQSKSGGCHYYFQIPRDQSKHHKSEAGKLGEGLDRKGDGGYVVWSGADLSKPLSPPPEWMLNDDRHGANKRSPLGTMRAPSFETARETLNENDPNDLTYSEWRDLVFAYRQAATGLAADDVVRAEFDLWCARYHGNNSGANAKLWASADGGTALGWDYLHHRGYGRPYVDPVALFGGREYTLPPGASRLPLASARTVLATLGNLLSAPIVPNWLIRRTVPAGAAGVMFGAPGTGKTFLAIDIAASVATGTLFNRSRTKQGPVVYVAGEGHSAIATRFNAWFSERNIATGADKIHISRTAVSFVNHEAFAALISEIDAMPIKPVLVVIDTLFRATAGADVNDAQAMSQFWSAVDSIKERYACTVLVVHHTGRQEQGRSFGSIVLLANADFEISLTQDATTKIATVENTKQKDGEPFPNIQYRLKQVHLGFHVYPEDGEVENVTSCVCEFLEPTETPNWDASTKENVARNAPVSPRAEAQREVGALLCAIHDHALKGKGIALTEAGYDSISIPREMLRKYFQGNRHNLNNGLNGLGNPGKRSPQTWIIATEDNRYSPKANLLRWAREDDYQLIYSNLDLSADEINEVFAA